jgi:hypothetical protein
VTGSARRAQEPWEVDREALSAAGVPRWAQVTGDDDGLRLRLFVWVNDGLDLEGRLVGDTSGAALEVLRERAAEVLRGDNTFGTRGGPADLAQPTALAVIHEHAVGHGSMGRQAVRPLAQVVHFAIERLDELIRQREP